MCKMESLVKLINVYDRFDNGFGKSNDSEPPLLG
jgi:hypothetical protein